MIHNTYFSSKKSTEMAAAFYVQQNEGEEGYTVDTRMFRRSLKELRREEEEEEQEEQGAVL